MQDTVKTPLRHLIIVGTCRYLNKEGQSVAAAWNDDKKSLVVLNSFIQVVEIGETKIKRIFKSKINNIALARIISDKGRYLAYCLIPLVGY